MSEEQRETLRNIFATIGAGLIIAGALVAPNILIGIAPFVGRKTKTKDRDVYKFLRYARLKRWIDLRETEKGVEISLTDSGIKRWKEIELTQPLHADKWDRKWRLVIFDIPDKKKKARDTLRYMLRRLGFVQLQESVWLTPFQCRDQIEALRQLLGIQAGVRLVTAIDIEDSEELLAKFNLES